MICSILIGATIALVTKFSRRGNAAYQDRLEKSDLSDPVVLQARFGELTKNVFPLLFLAALPIAIVGDFIVKKLRGVLNGQYSKKFRTCPLHALTLRLNFFNILITSNVEDFGKWMDALVAVHTRVRVSFTNKSLAPFHRAILCGVLRTVESLEPYLAWRRLTEKEYSVIHLWLANIATKLGIENFPVSLGALRTEMEAYETKYFANNPEESKAPARELLVSLTRGIARLFPFVGRALRPVLQFLLVAAMTDAYRTGFGLTMSRPCKVATAIALLPFRVLILVAGILFPFLAIGVNFGHIVRFADSRAEQRLPTY